MDKSERRGKCCMLALTSGMNSGVLGKVLVPTAAPSMYSMALFDE